MGTRENKVETYLKDQVKKAFNGETRKWVSPGHDGVHDQILFIDSLPPIFVEVKTIDGKLSPVQKREHERLKNANPVCIFATIYGHEDVDALVTALIEQQTKYKMESEPYA